MFKKLFFSAILLFFFHLSDAQVRFEGQLGGSNFVGYTANMESLLNLNSSGNHLLGINLGVGGMLPGWASEPTVILHSGLNYYFKNIGIGTELSGFALNPFAKSHYGAHPETSMIVYPNLSYTLNLKKNRYLKISGGVWLAYEKHFNYEGSVSTLEFAGDPIPGIGISFGGNYFNSRD